VNIGAHRLFAYDNEGPAFEKRVEAFSLAATPLTNAQWWSLLKNGEGRVAPPLGWIKAEAGWAEATAQGYRALPPDAPVIGVSFQAARTLAERTQTTLPDEFQWERAARGLPGRHFAWGNEEPDESRAFFAGHVDAPGSVKAHPQGKTPEGIWGLCGNAWEWTASIFAPYEGFSHFPYRGYSESSFDGKHRVLRGGSFATHGPLLRASFRNFYGEDIPEILATVRLAKEAGQPSGRSLHRIHQG
jgi:iron(II)-dependent oxidoreductase